MWTSPENKPAHNTMLSIRNVTWDLANLAEPNTHTHTHYHGTNIPVSDTAKCLYRFYWLIAVSRSFPVVCTKNRSEMMQGKQQMLTSWQANGIPAGRPLTGDRSELLSTAQRAWHNRPFISVSTDRFALQLARRPTPHSVWAEISKGNRSMTVSPTLTNKSYFKWNQSDSDEL